MYALKDYSERNSMKQTQALLNSYISHLHTTGLYKLSVPSQGEGVQSVFTHVTSIETN